MDIEVERSGICPLTLEQLWLIVADTNRLNRLVGMERVSFQPQEGPSAARFIGQTRLGGLLTSYEELPFEWDRHRWFRSRRRMLSGALLELVTEFGIAPAPVPASPPAPPPEAQAQAAGQAGTRLTLRLQMDVRWKILTPLLRIQAGQAADNILKTALQIAATVTEGGRIGTVPVTLPGMESVERRMITQAGEGLGGRLVRWVREAPDEEVGRIRPFQLADRWKVNRADLLVACMEGVQAGLFVMRWEIVCPGCRQSPKRLETLAEVEAEARCHVCDLAWQVSFDDSVEATFSPSPGVRQVDGGPWCSGGPAWSPHVAAQRIVAPGETVELPVPDLPGHYRVFIRGGSGRLIDVVPSAPPLEEGGMVAPGGRVPVQNATDRELHVRLDQLDDPGVSASARIVTAMPGFRERFSAQVLRPGLSMDIRRMTFFFSDLADSTKLYADIGDAGAFRVVQDHFDVVIHLLQQHRGDIVKTIGDAVMAIFTDEEDGLRASAAILLAFEQFVRETPDRGRTHIKLGLYSGPCFATEANRRLDYFGQTVNVAARLQGLARSGELVVEAHCGPMLEAQGMLLSAPEDAVLKGVRGPVRVVRARVPEIGAGMPQAAAQAAG